MINNTDINYEQLYMQKCTEIEELYKKLEDLKLKNNLLCEENKTQKLKITNSNTAKNGYKEEHFVCNDLNNNTQLKDTLKIFIPYNLNNCKQLKGNNKVDIQSNDGKFKAQVKKYKAKQFQQLDRHWIDTIIINIPELNDIKNILKNLCEIPLMENNKEIDKNKNRIVLSNNNYSVDELNKFLIVLNNNKTKILEFIFYGKNKDCFPEYLIGVEYIDNKRSNLIFFKIKDIISYLNKLKFEIKKNKTVISLGNVITIQRKGGDGGKKSSNQLQFKIIISLLDIKEQIKYKL